MTTEDRLDQILQDLELIKNHLKIVPDREITVTDKKSSIEQYEKFARELARTEKDKNILNSYSHTSNLHQNFYESNLDEKVIRTFVDDIRKIIGKLMLQMDYRAP